MKKFLLLGALAIGAMTANADYSEYYKVYYNGEEVENGATIVAQNHTSSSEEALGLVGYAADINFVNQETEYITMWANLEQDGEEDITFCYEHGGENGTEGTCTTPPIVAIMPGSAIQNFEWQAHLTLVEPDFTKTAKITTYACYGEPDEYEIIEDSEFTLTITFGPADTGVNSINGADNSAPVYYNLQGVRVENPENGLYIVKRGNYITKQMIRK